MGGIMSSPTGYNAIVGEAISAEVGRDAPNRTNSWAIIIPSKKPLGLSAYPAWQGFLGRILGAVSNRVAPCRVNPNTDFDEGQDKQLHNLRTAIVAAIECPPFEGEEE
jgi:hypothetical protein